jgi:pimeloyl-ACP methyl ester carboxylesterase
MAFLTAVFTSRQLLKSWYMLVFQLPGLPELAVRKAGGPVVQALRWAGMTDEEVARFREEMVADGAFSPALGWYRAVPLVDGRTLRKAVSVPTTFVWSDGDSAIARSGVERNRKYVEGDYELVVLEGVSHWIPTQAPEACADAILKRIAA